MADSTLKVCCSCREEKVLAEFGKDRQTPDGLQRRCKICKRAEQAAYRAKNKARIAEYGAMWTRANNEKRRQSQYRWADANREKYLAAKKAQREKNADRIRAYRQANKEALAEAGRRRRARMLATTHGLVDLAALRLAQCGNCGLCGELIDRDLAWPDPMSESLDHIVPLSKGGTHEQSNLQWTHLVCNLKKGAKAP